SAIGTAAFFDYISREHALCHKDRLSVESYEREHGDLHEMVKEYYAVEGFVGLLLSPRAPRRGDGFVCCSTCRNGLRAARARLVTPPKFSIANNFATGALPESLTFSQEDGTERTFDVPEEALTPEIRAAIAPYRPHSYVISYSGGRHASIKGTYQFFDSNVSQIGNAVDHIRNASNIASNIFIVMGGRMTPRQKWILSNATTNRPNPKPAEQKQILQQNFPLRANSYNESYDPKAPAKAIPNTTARATIWRRADFFDYSSESYDLLIPPARATIFAIPPANATVNAIPPTRAMNSFQ
ncbi:hypothetical protein THAOC_26999, partial [Thalassiosira oceanica]